MIWIERLAAVLDLAMLCEDLTVSETKSLKEVAKKVDREINKQTTTNRLLGELTYCTYSDVHDKKLCPCKGTRVAREPSCGWSKRLKTLD